MKLKVFDHPPPERYRIKSGYDHRLHQNDKLDLRLHIEQIEPIAREVETDSFRS